MALPDRTSAERAADLASATAARHERAQLRDRIKAGEVSVSAVLALGDDPIVSRMKVETLIESLPGYGKAKAAKTMDELDISHSRRIQGLGVRQKEALLDRFPD